jgi:glyoxylate/hydroxypyruvate reductase
LKIVLHATNDAEQWLEALASTLPEAQVDRWSATGAADADYAIVWKPPSTLLRGLERVKAIFNLGAGVDSIPDLAELRPEVPLVRLDDAGMAEQMSEYVCCAALSCYRELDAYADQQREALWRARPRQPKRDFVVGILGAGVLGTAVARALAGFGFPLRMWSRTGKQVAGVDSFAGMNELEPFLSVTRFLVCLLPLTAETENLLDRARLGCLPRGAFLVNVARGGLVVDRDLLALLDEAHLAGAMLDVFRDEPLPADNPFWHHRRVVLTPHVSAVTLVRESVEQIAAKIRRVEAGLPITGVIDRQRGY